MSFLYGLKESAPVMLSASAKLEHSKIEASGVTYHEARICQNCNKLFGLPYTGNLTTVVRY